MNAAGSVAPQDTGLVTTTSYGPPGGVFVGRSAVSIVSDTTRTFVSAVGGVEPSDTVGPADSKVWKWVPVMVSVRPGWSPHTAPGSAAVTVGGGKRVNPRASVPAQPSGTVTETSYGVPRGAPAIRDIGTSAVSDVVDATRTLVSGTLLIRTSGGTP